MNYTRLLITLVLTLFMFSIVFAQEGQSSIPVVSLATDQQFQVVVSDGAGGSIIAWQDMRSGSSDIYAQRVSENGTILWAYNGLPIVTAINNQEQIAMISDGVGGAILTWQDIRSGFSDIYAQRINANGSKLWNANDILICSNAYTDKRPKLTTDGGHGAFITWTDNRHGDSDVFIARINAEGNLSGTTNGSLITDTNYQINPEICSDGAGGAIIVYEQYINGLEANMDVRAVRINQLCEHVTGWPGAAGVPVCIAAFDQRKPKLVNDGLGSAIITWQDRRSGTEYDIYAQRVYDGTIQWTANGIPVRVIAYDQINPQIISAGLNTAIIVWQDFMNGTNWDLYAQKVTGTTSGSTLWTAATGVRICIATASNQTDAQAISDGAGGVIVAWQDDRNYLTTGHDIYSEHLDSSGSRFGGGSLDPDGGATCTAHIICTHTGNQVKPMLALKNTSMAICVWMDYRSQTDYDIYTSGTSGTLPVTLSVLTANYITSENLVNIFWRVESEINHLGYRILRSNDNVLDHALLISNSLISEGISIGTAIEYSYEDTEIESNSTYNYWLQSIDIDGSISYFGPITATTENGHIQLPDVPLITKLGKAYPNPFNPETNISYSLINDSNVKIEVFNTKGQKIKTLISKNQIAGLYKIRWDGTDQNNKAVGSGTYFYKMTSDNYSEIRKMLLIK